MMDVKVPLSVEDLKITISNNGTLEKNEEFFELSSEIFAVLHC